MLPSDCFECKCYVSFFIWKQNSSTFRIKNCNSYSAKRQVNIFLSWGTRNHISWQVLWNWLMSALNHKHFLSLLGSSDDKAVPANQYLMGLKIRTEQQGTAKCYLKSTCLTPKLNPKSTVPTDRKKGREHCLSLQMSCMPHLRCHSTLFHVFSVSVMPQATKIKAE